MVATDEVPGLDLDVTKPIGLATSLETADLQHEGVWEVDDC